MWSSARAAGDGSRAAAMSACERRVDRVASRTTPQLARVEAGVAAAAASSAGIVEQAAGHRAHAQAPQQRAPARSGACSRAATTARQAGSEDAGRG